jgi:hypothetical protein
MDEEKGLLPTLPFSVELQETNPDAEILKYSYTSPEGAMFENKDTWNST